MTHKKCEVWVYERNRRHTKNQIQEHPIPMNTHTGTTPDTQKSTPWHMSRKSVHMYKMTPEMATLIYRKYIRIKPVMNPSKLWQATTSNVDRTQFTNRPFTTHTPIGSYNILWLYVYTYKTQYSAQAYRPRQIRDTRQAKKTCACNIIKDRKKNSLNLDSNSTTVVHVYICMYVYISYFIFHVLCFRSDIKSSGKCSIFRRLKIDPETPPLPLSLVQFYRSREHRISYPCITSHLTGNIENHCYRLYLTFKIF